MFVLLYTKAGNQYLGSVFYYLIDCFFVFVQVNRTGKYTAVRDSMKVSVIVTKLCSGYQAAEPVTFSRQIFFTLSTRLFSSLCLQKMMTFSQK